MHVFGERRMLIMKLCFVIEEYHFDLEKEKKNEQETKD